VWGQQHAAKSRRGEEELQAAAYLASTTSRRSIASIAQNTEPELLFPAKHQAF